MLIRCIMVDLALLQSVSYIAGALGVCVAASYYVMTLRNIEREKRKQLILQKLPSFSREHYENHFYIFWNSNWTTSEEYQKKYGRNMEIQTRLWQILNTYNILGILYQEGLMSLDDIAKLYAPRWILRMYEMSEYVIKANRLNYITGKVAQPELMKPLEDLYLALRTRFPDIETLEEFSEFEKRNQIESPMNSSG
jgi:hypothetical protein